MKKSKLISLVLSIAVIISGVIVSSIPVNAAANETRLLKASCTNTMNEVTWVKIESDTKQTWQFKRNSNDQKFTTKIYTNDITNKTSTETGTDLSSFTITLGSLKGQAYNLSTKAIQAAAQGSSQTLYGSTYVKVTTNGKDTSADYTFDKTKLNVSSEAVYDANGKRLGYERLKIEPKAVGTFAVNLRFTTNNVIRRLKINVKVLDSETTVKQIDQAQYGTYKSFEKNAKGATCWAAANDVMIWKDFNCTQPLKLNVKKADGTWTTTSFLKVDKGNGKTDYLRFYVDYDSTNKITISGNKMYVRVWDAKLNKHVKGYVYDTRVYINLPDIIPSIDYTYINSISASARCSGVNIPSLTGKALSKRTAAVPVRVSTARLIQRAQNIVKRFGLTVSIAEAYRPLSVQNQMSKQTWAILETAYNSNNINNAKYNPVRLNLHSIKYGGNKQTNYTVAKGLKQGKDTYNGAYKSIPDNIGWFIANGSSSSSHQNGRAIDCALASYATHKQMTTQCPIQDLSAQAIITDTKLAANDGEKALNYLFTNQGMKSLISEWWHFEEHIACETYKTASGKTSKPTHNDTKMPNLGILQCCKTL